MTLINYYKGQQKATSKKDTPSIFASGEVGTSTSVDPLLETSIELYESDSLETAQPSSAAARTMPV